MANRRSSVIARRKRRRERESARACIILRVMAKIAAGGRVRVIRKRGYVVQAVVWIGDQTIAWRPRSGIGPV